MVLGWLFGKAADSWLRKLKKVFGLTELESELAKTTKQWGKDISGEVSVNTQDFFDPRIDPADEEDCPERLRLKEKLEKFNLPSEGDWHAGLMENWDIVKKRCADSEPHPFYELGRDEASGYLQQLANALYLVCAKYPEIFMVHTAEMVTKMAKDLKDIRQLHGAASEERQRYAGRTDELIHALMRRLNDAAQEGPRLFSMIPDGGSVFNPRNLDSNAYHLTLWCEMPGWQHPVSKIFSGESGDYHFRMSRSWWKKCGPWAKVAAQILCALVPVAGAGGKATAAGAGVSAELSANIDLMEKTVGSLFKINEGVAAAMSDSIDSQTEQTTGLRKSLDGEDLRAFHRFLRKLDKDRHPKFGGLQKTHDETGTCLWLCPEHYKVYNPDLPVV